MSMPFKRAQLVTMAITIAAIALVALSDRASQEEWSFYCGKDGPVLKKYDEFEQCSTAMKGATGCGCRRTDGPYGVLNKVADLAFGAIP